MRSKVGGQRTKVGGIRSGVGLALPAGSGAYATTFTATLSNSGGAQGSSVTLLLTPGASGGFAPGLTPQLTLVGFAAPAPQSTTAGSNALNYTLVANGASGTNAYVTVSIAGMNNQSGQEQYAIAVGSVVNTPPPTPTTLGNRYDVALNATRVPAGTAVAGTVTPTNGLWNGGTLPLIPSNGDPTINVALPSSGNAAVAFSYTPSKEGSVWLNYGTVTGLNKPSPQLLNVFANSNGVARTITAHFLALDLMGVLQQTPSGEPSGFSLYGRGAGRQRLVIDSISGNTSAIWMRPHAADPHAATGATAAGTGNQLHAPVQVYGSVTSTGEISVLLPASIPFISWDIAGDSAMTNAYRIQQRARVGRTKLKLGRSILNTSVTRYAYGGGNNPQFTPRNQNTTTFGTANGHSNNAGGMFDSGTYSSVGGVAQAFLQYDYSSNDRDGYGSSPGVQEEGRLCEYDFGVGLSVYWVCENGQSTSAGIDHNGVLNGNIQDFVNQVAAVTNGFREIETGWAVNASEWSDTSYPNTVAERVNRYKGLVALKTAELPSVAVFTLCDSGTGWFGGNGSKSDLADAPGFSRTQVAIREQIAAINPMVVSRYDGVWNGRYGGHPRMGSRLPIAQTAHAQYRQGEHAAWGGLQLPYALRHPTLSRNAQWIPAQNLIRVFGNYNGATGVQAFQADFNDPLMYSINTNGPSAAALAATISVYAGYDASNPHASYWGTPLATSGAVLSTSNLPSGADFSLDITLVNQNGNAVYAATGNGNGTGSVAMPSEFTLHYGDWGASNNAVFPSGDNGSSVFITDKDHINTAAGLAFGHELHYQVDIHATQ